jgi:hypothetical protein
MEPPLVLPVHESLRSGAVWWRETLLRIALALGFALVVEWFVYGAPLAAFGVHPHPYWLAVLPLAASRGLVAGLTAAALAGAIAVIGGVLNQPGGLALFSRSVGMFDEPLLFLVAAIVVGELCDSVRGALREVASERDRLSAERDGLRHERDVLDATVRELERRLAYGPGDVASLVGAARRMASSDRFGLYEVTLDLVLEHVGDAASIVEVARDGSLVLVRARGGTRGSERDLTAAVLSPLVVAAVTRGEAGNVYDLGGDVTPPGPRMVAPLFDHAGAVHALLLLDDLAPARLAPQTFRTFAALADWASSGLGRLAAGASPLGAGEAFAPRRSGMDVPRRLGSPEELEAQLLREFARGERHALNLAVLGVQFTLEGERAESVLERLDVAVVELLGRGLRASDGLHAFGLAGCYALVLAATDARGAAVTRARIEAAALAVERRLGVGAKICAVGPELGEVTPEHVLESLGRRFRAHARRPLGIPERDEHERWTLGDLTDLVERIAGEAELERRFGLPFQLFEVGFDVLEAGDGGSDDADDGWRDGALPSAAADAFSAALRVGTEAFELGPGRVALLLPGLGAAATPGVVARLEAALVGAAVTAAVARLFDSEAGVDVTLLVSTLGGRAA